jgi:hypothetical protein
MFAEPGSFVAIVELVKEDIANIRVRAQPGQDPGLTDCTQAIFTFDLPKWGDALFNGPYGYRAQYWLSPFSGLAANAHLISALTQKLQGSVDVAAIPELQKIDLRASLRAASAKVWIQEIPSVLRNPTRDLAIPRWSEEADRGVQLALWGLCAPEAVTFQVKSALMDPHGNEVVPVRKVGRHFDIHNFGFS